ncbi:uncharacterized protein LOC127867573 [Dreissena polymorpha]|uniref:uncharacterized protein LOC127867573 n=1 Tax=Dreissena polymorpha TaxID=45954 RepID=UPI002263E335|nr:uncharacterized protein LOC127867573 [Dreissena polymorpha]
MNMGLCCPQVSRPGCENSSPAQVAFEEARRRILGSRGGTSSQGGDFGSQSSMDTSGFQSGTDMPGSQSSFDTRGLQRGTDMSGSQDSFDTRGFQRGTDMPASQGSFDTRGFQGAPDMMDPQDSRDMRGFSRAPDMQRQQMSAFPSQPRTPEVPMRPMSPCGGVPPTGYCVMAPFPRCPVAQRCVGVGFGRGVCCPLAPMMGMPPGMPPFIPRMSPIGPRDRCPRNAPCVRRGRHECYTDTDCPAPLACCHIGDGCQRRCLPSP